MDKQRMHESYSYLFDIEFNLIELIEKSMYDYFGYRWRYNVKGRTDIYKFTFLEIALFIKHYSHAFPSIDRDTLKRIIKFRKIRNKICHLGVPSGKCGFTTLSLFS